MAPSHSEIHSLIAYPEPITLARGWATLIGLDLSTAIRFPIYNNI